MQVPKYLGFVVLGFAILILLLAIYQSGQGKSIGALIPIGCALIAIGVVISTRAGKKEDRDAG